MIFGMPSLIELNNLDETMQLCRKLGLSFVELNMNLPPYQLKKLENTAFLKELKDRYQVFYTIHLDENLNISDFNPLVADAYRQTVERTIEVAKKLEMPVLNMHMNHGIHFTLPDKKVNLFEQYKEIYLESMLSFRDMCENIIANSDIHICIENTDGFRNYEKEAIELLLQSKVFALTWDIGHSNASDNIDESFLLKNAKHLYHFHIHDGRSKSNHMALGTGDIDLEQRLNIAKQLHCRCVIETKTVESLKKSVSWLEEHPNLKR